MSVESKVIIEYTQQLCYGSQFNEGGSYTIPTQCFYSFFGDSDWSVDKIIFFTLR